MGFLSNIFGTKKTIENSVEATAELPGFVLGVEDTFALKDSEDLVVVGKVKGTVHIDEAVYVTNFGDDESHIFLTVIKGIETGPGVMAMEATDCHVGLRLENAKGQNMKCGTVLYTRNISIKDVHQAYYSCLGDVYVMKKNAELTDEELEKCSIADCAEIWRLAAWIFSKATVQEEATKESNRKKVEKIAAALCKKILEADTIYCLYSKQTGAPYLFSQTVRQEEGYMCTPPDILIFPKAYKFLGEQYPEDIFELREITNGEQKKGIETFLGQSFYMDGACGVQIASRNTSVAAEMLVKKPDFNNLREIEIPIMNPDLERWLLLLGQLGEINTPELETIYKLYYRFMAIEMVKARFLIPMQKDGEVPPPDEDGKTVLQKGLSMSFPTIEGKYGRPAVRMYTDWKRLKQAMGEQWEGLVQPIEGMIEVFDCAINLTEHIKEGCYVGAEMFEEIKKLS